MHTNNNDDDNDDNDDDDDDDNDDNIDDDDDMSGCVQSSQVRAGGKTGRQADDALHWEAQ